VKSISETYSLYLLKYVRGKHTEVFPCVVVKNEDPPTITDLLISKFGVHNAVLAREDESAEWQGPFCIESLPDANRLVEVETMMDRIKEAVTHLTATEIRNLAKTLGVV